MTFIYDRNHRILGAMTPADMNVISTFFYNGKNNKQSFDPTP